MTLILEQIIRGVLKEHVDSNLESEHARETIASEITNIYFTSSNDTVPYDFTNRTHVYTDGEAELKNGGENEELDK